ncbi:MAG: response regulator [Candidatus Scalindua sp.]|nr:response regulator [Candidatus Scalindua sp.]
MPKILIVDDEPGMRLLLEQSLEELEEGGVELFTSSNGDEAVEFIRNERPSLVLLDVMLPGKNGFEVCDEVKNKLGMKNVYVLMLTAKGQDFDKQRGLNVGVDSYMTKPFDPDDVVKKIVDVLRLEI